MKELFNRIPAHPIKLALRQDRIRDIKRGYPWVFKHSLIELPAAVPGTFAVLRDRENRIIAKGFYDPNCPIAFRVCALEETLTSDLIRERIVSALDFRASLFDESTNAFRLINGEGDGLPGIVCDRYAEAAVVQLDGAGPSAFWNMEAISELISKHAGIRQIYLKPRSGSDQIPKALIGTAPQGPIAVLEHGAIFEADLVDGQKSGFFLDQRENRQIIRQLAHGRRVLNLFGYTGGFSIAAGRGGAREVTTVDIARPAIVAAERNWALNNLPHSAHRGISENAFDFIDTARETGLQFDLIIADPPSFASSQSALEKGENAYITLFSKCIPLLSQNGILAAASCSSHVSSEHFIEICLESFSRARRRATVRGIHSQPADHPFPLACRELQYLKFVLLQANDCTQK